MIQKAYKFRLYPNKEQREYFAKTFGNHKAYTTNNQKGSVAIVGKYIKLPKIGYVRLKQHREFIGTIKSVTVSQVPSITEIKYLNVSRRMFS